MEDDVIEVSFELIVPILEDRMLTLLGLLGDTKYRLTDSMLTFGPTFAEETHGTRAWQVKQGFGGCSDLLKVIRIIRALNQNGRGGFGPGILVKTRGKKATRGGTLYVFTNTLVFAPENHTLSGFRPAIILESDTLQAQHLHADYFT